MAAYGIKSETFSKKERLRRRKEYERVYKEGKRLYLPYLKIVIAPNELGYRRMGLSVSKKVGKAVTRNRIKRILREIFRKNKDIFPSSCDIVFIPRAQILEIKQAQVVDDLARMFRKYEKNRFDNN
ncbi:ribonuclease P protein component [Thermodesulfatator atlanticus]|uniref:ribonuclease P protein component n=1 Tax=Thermodesulfatator atlanticus TaxID=501497 RepID=UPI000405641E|nr:ribonuclease P protein component [Thermodesulfatator atlanticus]